MNLTDELKRIWLRIEEKIADLKTLIVLGAGSATIGNVGLNAGTNTIGKLGANSGVDIGDVDVKSIAAGETHIGSMGGNSDKITNTITTTNASAYTAEDNIGGINTIANVLRVSGGTEILMDILIWDKDDQKAALQIDYWDASPSGTYTNDAGQVIAGDSAKWLGTVEVSASDYKTTGAVAKAVLTNLGVVLKGNGSRNIFFTIKTTDTPTYTSTSGLIVKHGVLQD